ncbi:MAG: glutathione S-transferase family protein [Proteobacteria bacterium]|nr:MAG: glutathione S-transferase family protein [Pseudomonadota bacterium]
MGRLESGKWVYGKLLPDPGEPSFKRQTQAYRSSIEPGGEFPPEIGRYHLYVSYACPWACRALIFRNLKNLNNVISLSVVSPDMLAEGWTFEPNFPGVVGDSALAKRYLYEVYQAADPRFSGEVTVPVLFDRKTNRIVNNESSEIIRIFNEGFNGLTGNEEDFYPAALRAEIDELNADTYPNLNNGVYAAGFAGSQDEHEANVKKVFSCLERLEERLEGKTYLVGERLTEADVRVFTTLIRFDPVYHGHFKCNLKLVREYANLKRYLAFLYRIPAFRETTHFDHIKRHYYFSHEQLNPRRLIPLGPFPLVAE